MDNKKLLKGIFNKADLILALVLVLLGLCSLFVLRRSGSNESLSAVVTVSGEIYGKYPLSSNREIQVESEYGTNLLKIEDGTICMAESGCPNHDCEGFGRIKMPGQMIICIPNRVVVTIEGSEEPEIDAFLY